ncbi:MAG TPA: hypothetical protein VG498_19720, partial [Terriglobales bacterium]|nr:hypothetical protein [Terriglobales bacterium]
MSVAYEGRRSFADAVEASLKAHSLSGTSEQDLARLRDAFAQAGIAGFRQKEAEITIETAKKQTPTTVLGRLGLAHAYAQIGNDGAALDILEKICDERSGMAVWTKIDYSQFPAMRSDSRFQTLLRRIGLPE